MGVERNEDELVRAIEHMGERASEAAETSLPSSIEEPSSAAATERQTAAIVRALDKRSGSGGNTYVNITSPEALDEKTAAREFKGGRDRRPLLRQKDRGQRVRQRAGGDPRPVFSALIRY